MRVGGQSHALAALPIVQEAWCASGSAWMGPGSLLPPGFEPGTFRPATSRYTD